MKKISWILITVCVVTLLSACGSREEYNLQKGTECLDAGKQLAARGNYEQAIKQFRKATTYLKEDPDMLCLAYMSIGMSQMMLLQKPEAFESFSKVVEISLRCPVDKEMVAIARVGRATYFRDIGKMDEAESEMRQVAALGLKSEEAKRIAEIYGEEPSVGGNSPDEHILILRQAARETHAKAENKLLTQHIVDFFNSVNTIEEAVILALEKENPMYVLMLLTVVRDIPSLDPVVVDQAIITLKKYCRDMEKAQGGAGEAMANFATLACVKVGRPALPKLRKLMLHPAAKNCSLFIQEEIQKTTKK